MKKISRIRWLTTLMGLVVLMFTCAGCGQTAAQSNVPKPDASQSRVRIYESMVELEDDSPLIITGEISRTSVIRDIDDITDFTLLDVKVSQTLKGTVNSGSIIVRQTGSAEQGSAETLLQTGDVVMLFLADRFAWRTVISVLCDRCDCRRIPSDRRYATIVERFAVSTW